MKTGRGFHPPSRNSEPVALGRGVRYLPPGYTRDPRDGYIAGVCIGDYATGDECLTRDEVAATIAALQECLRLADGA